MYVYAKSKNQGVFQLMSGQNDILKSIHFFVVPYGKTFIARPICTVLMSTLCLSGVEKQHGGPSKGHISIDSQRVGLSLLGH